MVSVIVSEKQVIQFLDLEIGNMRSISSFIYSNMMKQEQSRRCMSLLEHYSFILISPGMNKSNSSIIKYTI